MFTKKDKIGDIIIKHQEIIPVIKKHGLRCLGCPAAGPETIEGAAQAHGIDLDLFLNDLNEVVGKKNND